MNDDGPLQSAAPRPSIVQRAWWALWRLVERLSLCLQAWQPPEGTPNTTFNGPAMVEARLLVLGASDTGKSTFMKQMRYVFGDTFPIHERRRHLPHIRRNLLESVHKLVLAMDMLGVPYSTPEARDAAGRFVNMALLEAFLQEDSPMDPSLVEGTRVLWDDDGIQEIFRRGNEYHLMTNADHFITSAHRILHENYLPSIDDILRMRYPTQCSVTSTYDVGEMRMTMHDMGGQRGARGEWVTRFERPTAILFLASLAEYDQTVEEADQEKQKAKNRVQESLDIFEALLGYPPYHNTPVILLLNKSDIFRKKITYHSIADYFPQYNGPEDEDTGREFLSSLYEGLAIKYGRHYVSRFTEATNTDDFKAIISFVKTNVSRNMISRGGLL